MGGSKRRLLFARAIMGAALAAAVLFAIGPGAAAGEPARMISGSWALDRFDDESTGIFSDCGIAARYGSSRVLVFLLDRDSAFIFSLSDPGLRFDDNVPYRAVLSIDCRHIGDYKTQVKDRAGFQVRSGRRFEARSW